MALRVQLEDMMDRLWIASACALVLASPALADDDWDRADAISKTVAAQRVAEGKDKPAEDSAEDAEQGDDRDEQNEGSAQRGAALRDRGRAAADAPAAQPGFVETRDHSVEPDRSRSTAGGKEQDQRTSNVLGPLWGTPQDAPVMKHIDPELEKQYARDSQGRLVPRDELSPEERRSVEEQERAQHQAEREAQFERDRQERAAKAEAKRMEREASAAEQQRERELREAEREAQREAQRADGGNSASRPAPDGDNEDGWEDEAPAPQADSETRDEHFDHKVGGRSTPEDEGW